MFNCQIIKYKLNLGPFKAIMLLMKKKISHTLLNLAHAINGDFSAVKIENFIGKKKDIFKVFAQNIDCGYTLEPPR